MLIKRVLIFGLGLFFCFSAQTQNRILKWENDVMELGSLTEGDSVSGVFSFFNSTQKVIRLIKLQTTCGCTSTDFVEGKILAPQSVDRFTFLFRSAGQVGHLHKLLVMEYQVENQVVTDTLLLHGEVLPKKPSYHELFPYKGKNLLLLTPMVVFGNVSGKEFAKAKITLGVEGIKKERVKLAYLPKGVRLKTKRVREGEVEVLWLEMKVKKMKTKGFVEIPFLIKGKKSKETFDLKLSYYLEGNR